MKLSFVKTIKDYLKGIFLYNLISEVYTERSELDGFVTFILFGKFIGFPCLFNYYHMRLLPYYALRLGPWKKRILKERDFFDRIKD